MFLFVGACLLLVITIVVVKNLKICRMMSEKTAKLKNMADSWPVHTPVVSFDPSLAINEEAFEEMRDRLKKRIVNDNPIVNEESRYGLPPSFINTISEHMIDVFDINHVNNVLGEFDHFKTVIGDINLHFVHMKGSEGSTPVLLLHGWPSTIWEFHKSLPILVQQGYSVVVPSLPGHGFTESPPVKGVAPCLIACTYHKLMIKLGYSRYVVHGCDLGAMIGAVITYIYPEHVIGLHNTLNHIHFGWRQILQVMVGMFWPHLVYTTPQEEAFINPISEMESRMYKKFAYFHVQTVMPDTLGYGLVDSPVGLISWIGSPLVLMSAKDNLSSNWERGLSNFGIDNVCATLAIFWCMRNAQSSMRFHYEFYWNDREYLEHFTIPRVPVAISNFPNEIIHLTKFTSWRTFNNIRQFTYHKEGGHFPHIDNTEGIVGDIVSFINNITSPD